MAVAGAPEETAQEAVREAGKKDKKKKGKAGGEGEDLDALLAEFGVNAQAAAGHLHSSAALFSINLFFSKTGSRSIEA